LRGLQATRGDGAYRAAERRRVRLVVDVVEPIDGEQTKPNRTGEAQTNRNRETTGQAPERAAGNRTEGNKATSGATEERRLDQNRATEERGRDNDRNRSTTGQGAAPNKGNVSVNITPEKRTQMHQVFTTERSAPRVDRVDFDLAVGTAVPRSGTLRFYSEHDRSNGAQLARI
jgi:hypothetical protein